MANNDPEQQEIERLQAINDYEGLGQKVKELFKLPQSLCKTRGDCCRVATFKGSASYEELLALSQSDDPEAAATAREFLTLFVPYKSTDEVRTLTPIFVDRVAEQAKKDPEQIGFFHCRFLGESGRCLIHEDRPTGCRVYPFPHENTVFHPGCGFEERGKDSWQKIQKIMDYFEQRFQELESEADQEVSNE